MQTFFETKNCKMCKEDLPLTEFGISRAQKDGYHVYCKTCHNAKNLIRRFPDTAPYDLPWPLANQQILKPCISTTWSHKFDTQCGHQLIVDFTDGKHDVSLYSPKRELIFTYRFVNSDQTQAINYTIEVLHNQCLKLIPS